MSRSYKKSPVSTDGRRKTTKYFKNQANRIVRRSDGAYNGKSYRKLYQTWNIHDFISYWTLQDAIKSYEINDFWQERYGSLENFLNKVWAPVCRRK